MKKEKYPILKKIAENSIFTEGSDSGTLKFSNPVSPVKANTLNDIKDRIAKEEGFKNWTELTWEVNYTSYELLWGKVANELVKENQELKARIEELENEIKVLQQFDER